MNLSCNSCALQVDQRFNSVHLNSAFKLWALQCKTKLWLNGNVLDQQKTQREQVFCRLRQFQTTGMWLGQTFLQRQGCSKSTCSHALVGSTVLGPCAQGPVPSHQFCLNPPSRNAHMFCLRNQNFFLGCAKLRTAAKGPCTQIPCSYSHQEWTPGERV